jgi:putative NADPH-quinone reductase
MLQQVTSRLRRFARHDEKPMKQQPTVLIIQGHPDASTRHLCHGLAESYAAGARQAGYAVREISVAAVDFPILRSKSDFDREPLPAGLTVARDALAAADHVVLVFPLWLGTMPALLKAFFEQLFRPGVAFITGNSGAPRKALAGRTAHVVVTMGMPAWLYRLVYLAHGVRALKRNILAFVGIRPVRTTMFGMVEAVSGEQRSRWLAQMQEAGRRLR